MPWLWMEALKSKKAYKMSYELLVQIFNDMADWWTDMYVRISW